MTVHDRAGRDGTAGSDSPGHSGEGVPRSGEGVPRSGDNEASSHDRPGRSRDRDARGRARNARPRDATGRPLPRDAPGVEPIPEELTLGPTESITEAQRLLDADRPFAAHEVLEAAWKTAPDDERELWRGLAQLAVGLTHVQRGNARGAAALLTRAGERLGSWVGPGPYELNLDALTTLTSQLAEQISQHGTTAVPLAHLHPRLRAPRR